MVWLDADVFITGEPEAFELDSAGRFRGLPVGSQPGHRPAGDRYEPYWAKMCDDSRPVLSTLPLGADLP
jgi:hypothetical protein